MSNKSINSTTLYIAAWQISDSEMVSESKVATVQTAEGQSQKIDTSVEKSKEKANSGSVNAKSEGAPTLVSFSAPDYGIMFRCRVVCLASEAVNTAAMTGLRFLEISLKNANIEQVTLAVDSAAYYFQVTSLTSPAAMPGALRSGKKKLDARAAMLQKYRKKFKLDYKLIEAVNNPARYNCQGLPTTPSDVQSPLEYSPLKWPQKSKMMPLQNGVVL